MNTIQEQFQAAIEEFGEDAYKRFRSFWYLAEDAESAEVIVSSNTQIAYWLNGVDTGVALNPPDQLIAHDIEVYGEHAYLMWEIAPSTTRDFETFAYNAMRFYVTNRDYILRRKTTAALPFDLDRAKEGDVVEIQNVIGNWFNCSSRTFELLKHPLVELDHISVPKFALRMKYPIRLG